MSLVRVLYGDVGACPCCKEWVWHEVRGGEKFDCEAMVWIDSQICAACSSMLHSDGRYSLTKQERVAVEVQLNEDGKAISYVRNCRIARATLTHVTSCHHWGYLFCRSMSLHLFCKYISHAYIHTDTKTSRLYVRRVMTVMAVQLECKELHDPGSSILHIDSLG